MLPQRAHYYRPLWSYQEASWLGPFEHATPTLPLQDVRLSRASDALIVEMPMPGYQEDDIQVTCDGRTLAIQAQKDRSHTDLSAPGTRHAALSVRTVRRILLPEDVDGWRVSFRADGRLLTIHAPVAGQDPLGLGGAQAFLRRTWTRLRDGARRAWSALTGK